MRNLSSVVYLSFLTVAIAGCGGNKAFTDGKYDSPDKVDLLDDRFNEADMQQMAQTVVNSLTMCKSVTSSAQPPVVIVEKVENRTEEHIDMTLLTDKVRTALIKSGKVRFINKEERKTLDEETSYNESGAVSKETQKKKGKQIGADYILSGRLGTNIQQVGSDKFVYYKLTMNLTNMEASTIDCVEEKELKKKFKKKSVGI